MKLIFELFLLLFFIQANFSFLNRGNSNFFTTNKALCNNIQLSCGIKILIQGTKNAYTTIRQNDVISFKLEEPIDGCTEAVGVLRNVYLAYMKESYHRFLIFIKTTFVGKSNSATMLSR